MTSRTAPIGPVRTSSKNRHAVSERSPARAAVWSLVTASIYGFWWWWDVNRQLRDLGQPAGPIRAMALVTLGWVPVTAALMIGWPWVAVAASGVPVALSLLSVRESTTLLAAAQHRQGVATPVSVPLAFGLVAVALACLVAWFALSMAGIESGMVLGVAFPLIAMVFIAYFQGGLNRLVEAERNRGSGR